MENYPSTITVTLLKWSTKVATIHLQIHEYTHYSIRGNSVNKEHAKYNDLQYVKHL